MLADACDINRYRDISRYNGYIYEYNRDMKGIGKMAGVLIVMISVGLNFYFGKQLVDFKEIEGKHKVYKVLDGDSIVIELEQAVRLANLDAPEVGFCYGERAKENIEKLILGKYVRIERIGRDSFGRIIGMVYLNGQLINEIVVRNGWAKYTSGSSTNEERKELIKKVGREAKEKELGVWSSECYQTENLENPDCSIKGNIGKSDRVKIYHFPGCNEYERTVVELNLGEQWFCTEKEAQEAGYKKSDHCHGKKYK